MKYKLLIFDWDGTLANTHPAVVRTMQQVAADLQLPIPKEEDITAGFGWTLENIVRKLFPTADCQIFHEKFYQYCANGDSRDQLFDGTLRTLQNLQQQNYLLAIATNKTRKELLFSLDHLELHNYFCTLRCGDDDFTKPQPEVLHGILNELSVKPQDAVMIGDSSFDMLVAQNAKVDAIAVCCNKQQKQELSQYNPIVCIKSLSELHHYI